ncbi:MAG TPA: GAF domain-containing protein, partial [Bradyrhizobium sp.]|nr:GAF domain-containing protein [Bradyrhizobium sp.]
MKDALEQQNAISDILRLIASSPGNVKPVFDTVARHAARICEAQIVDIVTAAAGHMQIAATFGELGRPVGEAVPLDRTTVMGRSICDKQIVQVADLQNAATEFPLGRQLALKYGHRSILAVPLLREDRALGSILVRRIEVRPFEPGHIALLKTFADQAAIAIENARLLNELRQRTDDLSELLQQQTATADVLKVISRSTFDLQTVLATLVASAATLCEAEKGVIFLREGEHYCIASNYGFSAEFEAFAKAHPLPAEGGSTTARAAASGTPFQVVDLLADGNQGELARQYQRLGGHRTNLGVPLRREGETIGVFTLTRQVVRAFTPRQIELVETFADQAVIAIENVRLFEEVQARTEDLRESLQQQTATADVLKVISRSTFDLQTVLDTLVRSAARLAEANNTFIFRPEGDRYHLVASHGFSADYREWMERQSIEVGPHTLVGKTALEGRTVHIPDVLADPDYSWGESIRRGGFRTMLGIPLMREGVPVGVIAACRSVVAPFNQRQIELVTTFADQAVIAIENVRLFDEVKARTEDLRESLQQQTATAEVLKVISRSTFDLPAVLQTLVESAAKLCDAEKATITRQKDGVLFRGESYGFSREFMDYVRNVPVVPDRGSATARALLEGRVVHIPDVREDPDYTFNEAQKLGDFRTIIGVPMLREGNAIGVIVMTRSEVRPFTDKQIELATTFADQAAIAIENVRLFDSVETRTRELTASLEELRTAQNRLVQTEKLASLGQLTAGIAHEIKNPLNFVNNFSAVSTELLDELQETLRGTTVDDRARSEIEELTSMLRGNLEKILQHGKRADSIVKNMLLHSREGSGERRPVDLNSIVDESLNLAYHGARAESQEFRIRLERSFDPDAGDVELFPQEITRVFLN